MILHAGNVFNYFFKAMKLLKEEVKQIEKYFQEGKDKLVKCHKIQTELLTEEANGNEIPYSIILNHAQDHLTLAINWERMVQLELSNLS